MAVPPPPPPSGTKQPLRRALRRARTAHVGQLRRGAALETAAAAACARIAARLAPGMTLALYQPFGDEIDPGALATHAGRLALPHVAADLRTMTFRAWTPDATLVTGPFGLSQPEDAAEVLAPSVIVTPLVGFDRRGNRLGQGAGFYDRAFAALPGARRIGIAWSVQEVSLLPHDPWDVPLEAVATEREWIPCFPNP